MTEQSKTLSMIDRLREALQAAQLQIEYLDERFPTGTTPPTLTKIEAALRDSLDAAPSSTPLDDTAGEEIISLIRTEAKRLTGGNCTFVDDDLRAIVARAEAPPVEGEVARLRDALAEMRDRNHAVSGMSVQQVDEWYRARATEALATRTDPRRASSDASAEARDYGLGWLGEDPPGAFADPNVANLDDPTGEIANGPAASPLSADKLAELRPAIERLRAWVEDETVDDLGFRPADDLRAILPALLALTAERIE